jgi:hypothetical protein
MLSLKTTRDTTNAGLSRETVREIFGRSACDIETGTNITTFFQWAFSEYLLSCPGCERIDCKRECVLTNENPQRFHPLKFGSVRNGI